LVGAENGVGDGAFLNTSGRDSAQVYVIKSGTFFTITVQRESESAPKAEQAAALARKVANRI
jgi:hypothetical protein